MGPPSDSDAGSAGVPVCGHWQAFMINVHWRSYYLALGNDQVDVRLLCENYKTIPHRKQTYFYSSSSTMSAMRARPWPSPHFLQRPLASKQTPSGKCRDGLGLWRPSQFSTNFVKTELPRVNAWPHTVYPSDSLACRKSVFQAHASKFSICSLLSHRTEQYSHEPREMGQEQEGFGRQEVHGELERLFGHIRTLHPRTKRATHRMWAYRCLLPFATPGESPESHASHSRSTASSKMESRKHEMASFSDVEHASGPILERLLSLNDRHSDVVVVVYRWYGGIKLGSERWKCIAEVARQALKSLEVGEAHICESADDGKPHRGLARKKR